MRKELADKIILQSQENYNFLGENFSHTRSKSWPEVEELLERVRKGQQVLDIGCGNGRLYKIMQEKEIDVKYTGIDFAKNLVQIAQKKYSTDESKPSFKFGNILKIPEKDKSFDIVFCIAVFHHIPSYEHRMKALLEMKRVLKKGGLVLMTNWNFWQKKYLSKVLKSGFKSIFRDDFDFGDVHIPWITKKAVLMRYYHAYTLNELMLLSKKAGFEVLENKLSESKEGKRSYFNSWNLMTVLKKG